MYKGHLQSGCEHHLVIDPATSMSPGHCSPLALCPPLFKLCTRSTDWHPWTLPWVNADTTSRATSAAPTPCPHLHRKSKWDFYKQGAEKPRQRHATRCWTKSPSSLMSLHNSPWIMQTSQTSWTPYSLFRLMHSTWQITGRSYIYLISTYIYPFPRNFPCQPCNLSASSLLFSFWVMYPVLLTWKAGENIVHAKESIISRTKRQPAFEY